MNTRFLLLAAPFLAAASPPQGLSLQVVPDFPFTANAPARKPAKPAGPIYEPAPLPNPDVAAPQRAAGGGTEISPSLFNRRDGYRGDSFTRGETAQSNQSRRTTPSAGFTLKMPMDEPPQ